VARTSKPTPTDVGSKNFLFLPSPNCPWLLDPKQKTFEKKEGMHRLQMNAIKIDETSFETSMTHTECASPAPKLLTEREEQVKASLGT